MRQISLTKGYKTLVDNDVYKWAKNYKWHYSGNGYAMISIKYENGKFKHTAMHHCVIGHPLNNMKIDHIDGNGLNNQRSNLRIVDHRGNNQNQKVHREGHLLGTYLVRDVRRNNPWRARIYINGKSKFLGFYETEQLAHEAYLEAFKALKETE